LSPRAWTRALALLALLGVIVISSVAHAKRRQDRALLDDRVEDLIERVGRSFAPLVDIGVELRVVVADERGRELLRGKPKLRVLRSEVYGGILDTRIGEIVAPSRAPRVWYCSEEQEAIALHDDALPLGQLVDGSEGAGKTTVLAMWHYFRWLEHVGEGRAGGQTAPTRKRLKMLLGSVRQLFGASWFRHIKSEDLILLADGTRIELVSTHKRSAAEGSQIQGQTWAWCGRDELQDQVEAHADIEARGRGGRTVEVDGVETHVFKQCATGTMKESSAIRSLRALLLESGHWVRRTLLILSSPFIPRSFVDKLRHSMTDREFRRRMLAEDLPPERMLYFNWDRARNLRPIPIGARKITSIVLERKLGKREGVLPTLLGGHDPGTAKAATILLECYEIAGTSGPIEAWWVRAEVFGRHKTTEQNAIAVLELARERFGVNLPRRAERLHVRAHPVGQAEQKPDENLYRVWRRVGIDTRAAEYKKDGTGTGVIKKDSRIDMINVLLCNAAGEVRLYVECDDKGQPVAPQLVEALESMERDEKGRAETEAKDEHDKSDCPAGLGYALWPWEKEAATFMRANARKAA
jgi:hypothetical protein